MNTGINTTVFSTKYLIIFNNIQYFNLVHVTSTVQGATKLETLLAKSL